MTLKKVTKETFELPDDISEDDENLLTSILSAMYAGEICSSYKINVTATGFIIRGSLSSIEDNFEIDSEDLQFITCVNPIRIERVAICNSSGKIELLIKVLNMKQRVMITSSCTFIANKKRKYTHISG